MIRLLRLPSWLLLTSFFFTALIGRAAETSDYGTPAGSIALPESLTMADVQKAILESAVGRGWNIMSRENGKVVLALTQDTWTSRLTLTYTTQEVQFFSVSTRKGKPKLPENWIKFLKQDIMKKLSLVMLSKTTGS